MSVLPVGRSLQQFFPDLDELLQDPAAYLKTEPIVIGPRKAYKLAALFGAFGGAFLLACVLSGAWHDERLLMGIGLLLGASVWLGWSLRLRGHSLLLAPDGVEVRYYDTSVWCPWALFNAVGSPIVLNEDDPQVAVILPIAVDAIPFVELRRNEMPVAHGTLVNAPQFRFTTFGQVILTARYEVSAKDLGELLLQLGSRLGRQLPRGSPPPEAYPVSETTPADVTGPDGDGWYTVSIGRLSFPPRCCDCEQPTETTLPVVLDSGNFAGRIAGTAHPSEFAVPFCSECQEQMREAYQRGGTRGLNAGAILGAIVPVGLMLAFGEFTTGSLVLTALAGATSGALLGFLAGSKLVQPSPVQFRRFDSSQGTLQLRFRDSRYAELVMEAIASRRNIQNTLR